jgi:serine/threonine-protein kinase RsbW
MLPAMARETPLQRHTLTLRSGIGSSSEASAWARTLAERAGLSEERVYALDLCIVEIVSNVVDYAYEDGSGEIRLELGLAPDAAVVSILDRGPAFDPLSVAEPAAATSLDDARIGGFGIHMVRSAVDGCRYERKDARNVFTAWVGEV